LRDFVTVGRSQVNPKILELGYHLAFFFRQQVNRFSSHHACQRPIRAPDRHALANQHGRIPATDRLCIDITFWVDVLDAETNLVAMPRQHHAHRGRRVLRADHVAVQIGGHVVGDFAQILSHQVLNRAFVS
jgi:hypothetical protein